MKYLGIYISRLTLSTECKSRWAEQYQHHSTDSRSDDIGRNGVNDEVSVLAFVFCQLHVQKTMNFIYFIEHTFNANMELITDASNPWSGAARVIRVTVH